MIFTQKKENLIGKIYLISFLFLIKIYLISCVYINIWLNSLIIFFSNNASFDAKRDCTKEIFLKNKNYIDKILNGFGTIISNKNQISQRENHS